MADANLSIEIRARVDQLQRDMRQAVETVTEGARDIDVAADQIEDSATDAGRSFVAVTEGAQRVVEAARVVRQGGAAMTTTLVDVSRSAHMVDTAASTASTALHGVNPAARGAANAFTSFGRVLQDLPYGIIGITNNLQELPNAFRALSTQARESGQSISSVLVQSLAGPAGLSLAFNAALSAISFASVGLQYWVRGTKEAKKSTDDYAASLDDVSRANLKGAQSAQGELNQLTQLYTLATNAAAATLSRKKAVDELQQQYPDYFKNIKDEVILAGDASVAYNRLRDAIVQVAQARAAETILEANQKRQLENEAKIKDEQTKQLKLRQDIKRLTAESTSTGSTDISAGQDLGSTIDLAKANYSLEDSIKRQNELRTDSNILAKRNLDLVGKINNAALVNGVAAITGSFTTQTGDPKKAPKVKPKKRPDQIGLEPNSKAPVPAVPLVTTDDPYLTGAKNIRDYTDALLNKQQAEEDAKKKSADYNAVLEYNNGLLSQSATLIGSGLTDAFASMLAGGQNAFAGFGQLILGLIAKIAAATAAAAILAALVSLIPGVNVAGASGAASFASNFGALTKSFGGIGIPKLAEGGVVSGPTLALIGEGNESEAVLPLSKLDAMMGSSGGGGFQDGQIITRIRGNDIDLLYTRTQTKKARIGR